MNLRKMMSEIRKMGYTPADARARVCQDVILKAIAKSSLSRNVTIKGGVVMRSVTRNVRRATQDMDIDFIRYSLSDESIDLFINKINCVEGVEIVRVGEIEELRSLLKFGPLSTRHKDIYDLYYHSYNVDILKLKKCLETYIFNDSGMKENNMKDIVERVNFTFANKAYRNYVDNSDKRWLDDDIQEIFDGIEEFLAKLIES